MTEDERLLLSPQDDLAEWEDISEQSAADEELKNALAAERSLAFESELEQDENPRDYTQKLEDEEEEAAPTSEKRLKRQIQAEALARLEDAARTEDDFRYIVGEWDRQDRNPATSAAIMIAIASRGRPRKTSKILFIPPRSPSCRPAA